MSRAALIFGLIVSAAVHVCLLRIPALPAIETPPIVVPIVETELAVPEPRPPMPAPEPDPEPVAPPQAEKPEPRPEPQPELAKVAEAPDAGTEEPGDFAGAPEGPAAPELRIDWGTLEQALSTMKRGGMILVVLDDAGGRPAVTRRVELVAGQWRRRPWQATGTRLYSNRLRIVDGVPAFRRVRASVGLAADERLAVLLPVRVERVLESAQMEAAFSRGLAMAQIDDFAGRFTLVNGELAFDITHVRHHAGSAKQ